LQTPLVITVLRGLIAALSVAGLIFLVLRVRRHEGTADTEERHNGWPSPLVLFLNFLVLAIGISCLLGYVALGRFLSTQVVATGGILLLMYLAHLSAEHLSSLSLKAGNADATTGTDVASTLFNSTFRIAAGLALDMLILVVGIPAILLQWGFDWAEVRSWLLAAFFGFQIGDYTISIQSALIAVALLVGGILATRLVQRWFMKRSDIGLRSDTGVRESIYAGLGYVGFVLSAVAAVSYLGINFANLAIIAGALSVGIGFGLQSIVNNFVSGLILLVERPVKSGDWISVGESDGLVRRISVRATELETLDKQSIIVPNSELISRPVTNWMYKERIGRINVAVGVSYNSDVDLVERVLIEAAKENKFVLSRPAPSVVFDSFGESSLDFLLRVFISDMEHKVPAASSLRFSVWRSLKNAGIEIPFPQRDIHVKEIQEVTRLIQRSRFKAVDTDT
jgi:small-conductance mechanosensitive channel